MKPILMGSKQNMTVKLRMFRKNGEEPIGLS